MSRRGAWWLCCFLAVCAAAAGRYPRRFGRQSRPPGSRECLALAEVELSRGGDIALVERREIARLLAEGNCRSARSVDAAAAVRAGKLLRADVLAVVETDPQSSQALGFLVFETASGMHLCDRALAEGDPEQAGPADCRGGPPGGDRNGLCGPCAARLLPGLRAQRRPAACGQSLVRRRGAARRAPLTNSPDIVVLERKRFEFDQAGGGPGANSAKKLSETRLLAAVLIGEIEIRRGNGEEILANAAMRHDGRNPLARPGRKPTTRTRCCLPKDWGRSWRRR